MRVSPIIWFPFEVHGQPFFKISRTDISSDAESREEQDGTKHFIVRSMMAELWLNLCEDVGEKEEESLLLVFQAFLRMDAFIGDVC